MENLTVDPVNQFCPYVGLRPYTQSDQDYFFGRERDTRVVAASLRAAHLTVLYGASGVGKSSVLMAGVLPHLLHSKRTAAVLLREWQSNQFAKDLKEQCLTAVSHVAKEKVWVDFGYALDDFLKALGEKLGGSVLVILDQFEEYLLYHANDEEGETFDAELARTINRDDVDANILISMREDSLADLDRFNRRIPNLLSNMLRLDHMDLVSANGAVRKPIEVYNERERGGETPVTIEDALVDAVLADVRIGEVQYAQRGGSGRVRLNGVTERVETSFLQLVLEKLWQVDVETGHRHMRRATYKQLGGAQKIVSSHFDQAMERLDPNEQVMCARFFDRLVTPSGTKIAYSISDLVQFAGGSEEDVNRVLNKLTAARILRTIEAKTGDAGHQVEIFHDVMAPAVLQWVAQFTQRKREADARRRLIKRIINVVIVLLFAAGFAGYRYYELWLESRPWASLEDISTGALNRMTGDMVSMGRFRDEFQNNIVLTPRTISRKHLLVYRDGKAHDLRSLNGTTVNAQFLPYNESRRLNDGDIVTLAGVAPFRYHTISYARFQFWEPSIPTTKPPADAWALVLDGSTRKVTYLSGNTYYLSLDPAHHIVLVDQKPAAPLMVIRKTGQGVSVEDIEDRTRLIVQAKEGDYRYPTYVAPSGYEAHEWTSAKVSDRCKAEVRHLCPSVGDEFHDLFEVVYYYGDTPFQIIPLNRDPESR